MCERLSTLEMLDRAMDRAMRSVFRGVRLCLILLAVAGAIGYVQWANGIPLVNGSSTTLAHHH